jgi:ABC-type antimicrobial peptide transport system permease subunit
VAEVDPTVIVAAAQPFDELLARPLAAPRASALLLAVFAAAAALVAAVGLYGVLAATVRLRAREMAVRRALGATPAELRAIVLRRGLGLVLAGVAIGVAGALAATRLLAAQLYEVSPLDPPAFVAAIVLLVGTALAACLAPARAATRADPLEVLRES